MPACASASSTAQYVINPTYPERKTSKIDLVVAGSHDAIMMVEAGAKEATEEEMVGALDAAHAGHPADRRAPSTTSSASAARRRRRSRPRPSATTFYREVEEKAYVPLGRGDADQGQARELRARRRGRSPSWSPSIPEGEVERRSDAKAIFKELKEKVLRDEILERGKRLDGRRFDEIRPIWIEVGVLPRVHGSAVFTRGETQALVSATLGTEDDAQKIETVDGEIYKRFMLHYNFPPFSVGEVQFLRGPGRREVGHGALAERALVPLLPAEEEFPYTLRVVSDILESNGSSSMASVCGGSLALMDAGVPLKAPVAGVAMGLVMDEKTGKWAVLTDIAGRRGPLRRHGLQGRRHARGHHGAADGHQGRRASRWTSCARRSSRRARAGSRSSTRWRAALPAPRARHLGLRAAHRHDPHPDREDPRRHRTGRQDDPHASSRRPASRSTSRTTAA